MLYWAYELNTLSLRSLPFLYSCENDLGLPRTTVEFEGCAL